MMTFKKLLATVLISSLASVAFAQTQASPKPSGFPASTDASAPAASKAKVHKVKKVKHVKVKKTSHAKKAGSSEPSVK